MTDVQSDDELLDRLVRELDAACDKTLDDYNRVQRENEKIVINLDNERGWGGLLAQRYYDKCFEAGVGGKTALTLVRERLHPPRSRPEN